MDKLTFSLISINGLLRPDLGLVCNGSVPPVITAALSVTDDLQLHVIPNTYDCCDPDDPSHAAFDIALFKGLEKLQNDAVTQKAAKKQAVLSAALALAKIPLFATKKAKKSKLEVLKNVILSI